jgi:tetratricopeptide (TPR) repeat protein
MILYFLTFIVLVACLILATRPVTTLLHELGHAIPAILLTKQKVTIYLGSFGNPDKSIRINFKLLEIFFRYNPFAWRLGVCVPSAKNISINSAIIYTITGPITSFIIAVVGCYFAFTYDLHGFLKLYLIVFLSSAVFDLFFNLIPNARPIKLFDGTTTHNDGYNLKMMFYYKRYPRDYSKAANLYNEQRFDEAAMFFEKILSNGIEHEDIFRLTMCCYLNTRNFEKIRHLSEKFVLTGTMDSDDFSRMGLAYSHLGLHSSAMEFYDRSLELNPHNKYSLNNKGFTLNLMDKFEEAITLFDRAIETDKDHADAHTNRGLSKVKLGLSEEGLKDIQRAIEIDSENSYGYRNLGIYYFDKGDYDEALLSFVKAQELDENTYLIDDLIKDAKYKSSIH